MGARPWARAAGRRRRRRWSATACGTACTRSRARTGRPPPTHTAPSHCGTGPPRAHARQQRLRRAAVGAPHGVGLKLRPPVGALGVQRRQHREVVQPEVGQAQAADGQRGMLAGQALV